jgi:hypothetical protein
MIVTKPIDLGLLHQELAAASIVVSGLGLSGTLPETPDEQELYTYDGDGQPAELPLAAVPIVDAHVAPPRPIDYAHQQDVSAIARTTDATPVEIFRFPCMARHVYRANLRLSGVDATNGTTRITEARFAWKRPATTAMMIGTTVVSNLADAGAASWTQSATAVGTEIVFSVTGAAGRTVDWLVVGEIGTYAPEGL